MTPFNSIKAAAEELSGTQEAYKVLSIMVRNAERVAGEAEVNLNALLKCHSLVRSIMHQQTAALDRLREEAEDRQGAGWHQN